MMKDNIFFAREEAMTQGRVNRFNPLQLAYVGDTVYDLFVRTQLLTHRDGGVHALSRSATALVCAHGQAMALAKIEPGLTEQEADIIRRGRNAHSRSVPRHADPAEYSRATALEALIGYLFLTGQDERITELMQEILNEVITPAQTEA